MVFLVFIAHFAFPFETGKWFLWASLFFMVLLLAWEFYAVHYKVYLQRGEWFNEYIALDSGYFISHIGVMIMYYMVHNTSQEVDAEIGVSLMNDTEEQ
jgi:hypothetical protein